jgi:hypothetical protein
VGQPTVAGFTAFIRNIMGISTEVLPDDAAVIEYSFNISMAIVPYGLCRINGVIYFSAVYNLAGDRLLNFAQDVPDAPPVQGSDPPMPFFAFTRKQYGINSFVAGVIESASDESTSESIAVPDSLRNLTIGDLNNLKTPYGRQYLSYAQDMGTLWGIA